MKITDIQIINFAVETNEQKTKWGYGQRGPQKKIPNGLIKILTDEGYSGVDSQYGF